jgi:hypothetical protein
MTCPSCRFSYMRETLDTIRFALPARPGEGAGVMSESRRRVAYRTTVESTDGGQSDATVALGLRDARRS